ncbi:MAG: hypothetical protein HUU55_22625 [Myxococcales bacterium]|nr:hypothetical protein [Myxococcales bacterium]
MLIDLLVYVNETPGTYSIPEVTKAAAERGLDGIILVCQSRPLSPSEVPKTSELKTFVGVELVTEQGVVLLVPSETNGAYANKVWGEPGPDGAYVLEQVLSAALEHRWAVVAVQPFDQHFPNSSGEQLISAEGIHAVIVTTGGTPLLAHDLALEAAMARNIPIVAGSNTRQSFNRLGSVATVFCREISSQKELCSAIIDGDIWTATIGGKTQFSAAKTPSSKPHDKGNRNRGRGRDKRR